MKFLKILVLFLSVSASANAQKLLFAKLSGLYKAPRWETIEHVEDISQKNGAYYDALYYLKKQADLNYFDKNHLLHFPGVYIFDRNLTPVKELNANNCGWLAQQFISTINDSSKVIPNRDIRFSVQDLLNHSFFADGDSSIIKEGNFDYLYVYTWVSYLPKFMKEQFKYSQEIKADTNVRIKIISLNADFMAAWNDHPKKVVGKKVK